MKTFTRLLAFLSPFRWRIALAILLGSIMIASSITLFGMAAYLIAAAALVPLLVFLSIPIYVVQLMGILRAVSRYVERLVSHNTTFRLLANLRVWAYKRIEPQAPAHLLTNRSGDMLARLVADIEELQNLYLRVVSPIVVALVISLFTFGIFSIFSIGMSWIALAFLILAGLGVPFLAASLSRGLGKQQLKARAELNTYIVDGLQGIQDVLAFGRTQAQLESVAACDRLLGQVQRRMARITGLQIALNDLLMNTAMLVLIVLAIPLVVTGYINGVYLGTIGLLILASFEAVQPLASAFQGLGHSRAAAERVFAVTDAAPPVIESATPQPIPASPDGYSLSFEHVHFTYRPVSTTRPGSEPYHSRGRGDWGRMGGPLRVPSVPQQLSVPSPEKSSYVSPPIHAVSPAEREILNNISFNLRPGTRIAIVGPSGSGKSTLVRLAVRFWDPTSGTICLNGQDIRRYSLHDLRNQIGVVAQDTYIFNDTLRANLLLARPDASDAEIEGSCGAGAAHRLRAPVAPGPQNSCWRARAAIVRRRAPAPGNCPRITEKRAHPHSR